MTEENLAESNSVKLRYEVNGNSYHHDVPYSFGLSYSYESSDNRIRLRAAYAVGRTVHVYYDPGDARRDAPVRRAVLIPGFSEDSIALMVAGAVAVLIGLVVLFLPSSLFYRTLGRRPAPTAATLSEKPRVPQDLSTSAAVATRGAGYVVTRDGHVISTVIDRKVTVPLAMLLLVIFGLIEGLMWLGDYPPEHWLSQIADYTLPLLLIGLLGLGLRKVVYVSVPDSMVWVEAGWFGKSVAEYQTSHWPLERFDRIVVKRTNWLGLDAAVRGNPRRGKLGVVFRVELIGDSKVSVNFYSNYRNAARLAYALSNATGYDVHELG